MIHPARPALPQVVMDVAGVLITCAVCRAVIPAAAAAAAAATGH